MTSILFQESRECDACDPASPQPFSGVCRGCGRRLCARHLHGPLHLLWRLLGRDRICPACRRRGE